MEVGLVTSKRVYGSPSAVIDTLLALGSLGDAPARGRPAAARRRVRADVEGAARQVVPGLVDAHRRNVDPESDRAARRGGWRKGTRGRTAAGTKRAGDQLECSRCFRAAWC